MREEKKATGRANRKNLHFNKDMTSGEESHSKINVYNESSSLNCSAMTSVNMIQVGQTSINHQRTSQGSIIFAGGRQFVMNPPQIVKALIQSKLNELTLKKKYEELL